MSRSFNIQFCKECHNVLQPQEDKQAEMLMLICKTCSNVAYTKPEDYTEHTIDVQTYNYKTAEDVKSYILPDIDRDPTLPRKENWSCRQCPNKTAVYFQLPERVADDAMTLVFTCPKCGWYEVKGKIADDDEDDEDANAS